MTNLSEALFGIFHLPTRTQHQYNAAEIVSRATCMSLQALREQAVIPAHSLEFKAVETALMYAEKENFNFMAVYWPNGVLGFVPFKNAGTNHKPIIKIENNDLVAAYNKGCRHSNIGGAIHA
jgi:hypothetical protein